MTEKQSHDVKGDRALDRVDDDKLGFKEVAQRIAKSLVDRASDDSLVVGLEGSWGSGKSSLLFLIEEELSGLPASRKPTVINFRPWLVGSRDALITSLFGELSNRLDQVSLAEGNATPAQIAKAKAAGTALRRFMGGLSATGSMIEVVGEASGFSPIKYIGKGTKILGDWAKGKSAPPQLSELKDSLVEALEDLGQRFIITIDDVDRLEPTEVIEVLRLIRSVVDLPNVIYLLCYDGQILAQSIEKAAGVKSGTDFLEKIVQLTVMVPKPEPLQLRQWFSDDLREIAAVKTDEELSRLRQIIDYEGGRQLRTPRSVVRALDGIRFFWPPLNEMGADLSDLVWLQLIKDGNPKLYRWLETYCATAAVVSLGIARVEDTERIKVLAELLEAVPDGYFSDAVYRHYFADQLPGVDLNYAEDEFGFSIFETVEEQVRDDAIRLRRLASPDHYRLYFALAGPSHALTQADVTSVWDAATTDAKQTGAALLRLHSETLSGSLTKADVLLERARDGAAENLSSKQIENIVISFSTVMDDAYRQKPFDVGWFGSLWDRASRLLPSLLSHIAEEDRDALVLRMFEEGDAIGWLTDLLRHETFAHGLYGDKREPEETWLLTSAQLDQVIDVMIARYRRMSIEQVFGSPTPISLLFAWMQAGDENGPRELISANIATDTELVSILENLTSTITSSNRGTYKVLKKDNFDRFMDFDRAVERLSQIEGDGDIGERATWLVKALEDGSRF